MPKRSAPRRFFFWPRMTKSIAPRFQRLVVEAYAGEKRVIALRGAHHNDPLEGAALVEFHHSLDWLLPRQEP